MTDENASGGVQLSARRDASEYARLEWLESGECDGDDGRSECPTRKMSSRADRPDSNKTSLPSSPADKNCFVCTTVNNKNR